MTVLYVALALLALLVAVLLIRAATFKPEKSSAKDNSTMETDGELYAKRFSEFIKVKTLSIDDPQNTDAPEHERFIALIQEMYPTVFSKCEFKRVAKYGLVLKFKGKSQDNPSCIMSHYDVVPVTEEMWTKDPFGGEISDGCVWGRGALDNKATLFCSMEAMEHTLKENPDFLPNDDIYFTFGGDEEIGGICQQEIVKEFEKENKKFKLVLDEGGAIVKGVFPGVSQDTAVVGLAEKGIANVELCVYSSGGHASSPSKDNPANVLARALVNIEKHPMKSVLLPPVAGMLNTLGRHSSFALKIVFANMWLFKPLVLKIFEGGNETRAMLTTTFAYTTLSGSNAHNIVPTSAKCNLNIRISNDCTLDDVLKHLKKVVNDDRVQMNVLISTPPSPMASIDGFGYQTVKEAMNEVYPEVIVSPYTMLAASDSRFYRTVSDNTLKFAPLRMSTHQRKTVHGNDEFVEISSLESGTKFYYNLFKKL